MHVEVSEAQCTTQIFDTLTSAFSEGLDESQTCLVSMVPSEKRHIRMAFMAVEGRPDIKGT